MAKRKDTLANHRRPQCNGRTLAGGGSVADELAAESPLGPATKANDRRKVDLRFCSGSYDNLQLTTTLLTSLNRSTLRLPETCL